MDPRANVHLRCALFGNSLENKKANRVKTNIYKFIDFIASHPEEQNTMYLAFCLHSTLQKLEMCTCTQKTRLRVQTN